ncbi:cupin domain-containing protein [Bacteriovoracaceae bacterium]|nr:cupin domain-containing protein [Bacteriovoracaceae bacterium]
MTEQDVIKKFKLVPLPEEGGYYKLTYKDELAGDFKGKKRSASTCIYYLVTPDEFSGLHAVKSTEIFHFYAGDPVEMVQISSNGELQKFVIGNDLSKNQIPQIVVEPMIWQGTKLLDGGKWALLGCTVSPGFEFEDFFNGTYGDLIERFPQHEDIIKRYTHDSV